MKTKRKSIMRLLFWTPRILCILFIVFISLFALDVFDEGNDFWHTILALLMHLIPTFLLIIILVISWRLEWVGGILFFALAIFYIVWAWDKFPLSAYFSISGPLFIISVLFLINWVYRKELRN
ncbi:MAG: hypothetical protein KAT68_09645 [Bacteroidales bacterium]|nr:hypothetical protein [Bacteroidales bacterium]